MCLGPLTPCVTSGHSDVLLQLLEELTGCLPGGSQAPESPVLLWQAGLALGSVLAKLWHHGFANTSGPKVRTLDTEGWGGVGGGAGVVSFGAAGSGHSQLGGLGL